MACPYNAKTHTPNPLRYAAPAMWVSPLPLPRSGEGDGENAAATKSLPCPAGGGGQRRVGATFSQGGRPGLCYVGPSGL